MRCYVLVKLKVLGFLVNQMMSMHNTWRVYRGDSSDEKDLLFTVKQSRIFQLKTQLDVFLPGNDRTCDFKVKGSWFDRSCTFYLGDTNTIIALVCSSVHVLPLICSLTYIKS